MEILLDIAVFLIAILIMYSVYYAFRDIGFAAGWLINFVTVAFVNIVHEFNFDLKILIYSIIVATVITLINKWIYNAVRTFEQYLILTIFIVIILGLIAYIFSEYLIEII